jgi:hypothetical protein
MTEDVKDKSPTPRLVATRLPHELAAQVESAAKREMISTAAYPQVGERDKES